MKKNTHRLIIIIGLILVTIAQCHVNTRIEEVKVVINQHLEEDGWYWTQFNLPPDGELMKLDNFAGYKEAYDLYKPLARYEVTIHGTFFGTFVTGGETRPKQYAYLPTHELNAGVTKLVFFAKDGSVWVIPVPEAILTPFDGESTTVATIYR